MPDIRQASTSFLQSSLAQLATGSGGVDAVSAATSGLQSEGRAASAAAAIEDAVYQQHGGDTGNAYREQMRSLALQLGKHNPDLGLRVLQGQAAPVQVASMDAEVGGGWRAGWLAGWLAPWLLRRDRAFGKL